MATAWHWKAARKKKNLQPKENYIKLSHYSLRVSTVGSAAHLIGQDTHPDATHKVFPPGLELEDLLLVVGSRCGIHC